MQVVMIQAHKVTGAAVVITLVISKTYNLILLLVV
jgi:hypothetical protein